jgi:small redox-active disulfide protein 2
MACGIKEDSGMRSNDIIQIKVDNHPVGVMGLKEAMEDMAKDFAHRPDQEIKDELLKRLSKKNYFPEKAKKSYGKAFLREFKKFLGRPCEEEVGEGIQIKVLGPGCPQCDRLEQELFEVMSQMNLPADLEHVRDVKEIGRYGVMGTPALIINGEVKSVGKVPHKSHMIKWLEEFKD